MGRVDGRVIAITGASSGIGQALAARLASEGACVIASARRTDRLEALAAASAAGPGRIVAFPADVTRDADMRALVDRAVEVGARLDVMVCNAGIGYHGTLDETTVDAMRRIVDVNVMGTLYAAQAALVAMRRQGHGHIIAVSSIVGRRGIAGSCVYAATKAAQVAFIESLRAEFVGTSFRASVVLPVATTTEFREAIARDFGHDVSGHGPEQSADEVAAAILDCIVRPRAEVYPFPKAWWLSVLGVVAPAKADRLVQRFGRRRRPQAGPDAPTRS
jgi:NADP-dependent 3-hydroxy acid dehydrogenase YdfG